MKSEHLPSEETIPNPRSSRRQRRADATRRHALSPLRIFLMVLVLPVTVATIALGVYFRTTDYEHTDAVLHLVALAGCDAAHALGMGTVREGQPGYHVRNDPDGDGVACEVTAAGITPTPIVSAPATPALAPQAPSQRKVGNAKFLKP